MSDKNSSSIKDHGEKRVFNTGSHRDTSVGKGRMDLLPAESVIAVYEVKTKTEQSYGNYADYFEEALIAAMKYMAGDTSENWLALAARASLIGTGIIESEQGDSDGNKADENDPRGCLAFGLKQTSIHYEGGALKYGENNWRKGQPMSVLMDSGMRHLTKAIANIVDEPHGRAAAWNFLGAIWTEEALPDMQNIETRQ